MREKKRLSLGTAILASAGIAAAGAAAYGFYQLYRWSKDEYSARFWVELGPLGIRVSKNGAPHDYVIDVCFGGKKEEIIPEKDDPVQEMELPLEALEGPDTVASGPAEGEDRPENEAET